MRIYLVKVFKISVVILFLVLYGGSLWSLDTEEYEREVYEKFISLFNYRYEHSSVRFTVEEGNVIGQIVVRTTNLTLRGIQPPRVLKEISFGKPERFKEHLRKAVTTQVANPNRTSKEERYLDHVISALGGLKDQEAVPLLKEIVFNATLPSDIRSDAMDTLAYINFEGNLEMFFRLLDPSEIDSGAIVDSAYRLLAHQGTPAILDRVEKSLDKIQYEDYKAMVRRLIARRRAELAGEEKKE